MTLYKESIADQTDHFPQVFVRKKPKTSITYGYYVETTLWHSKVYRDNILLKKIQE